MELLVSLPVEQLSELMPACLALPTRGYACPDKPFYACAMLHTLSVHGRPQEGA